MEICSWLADKLHFILSYEAGFYKPTVILKVHPPFLQDYSICNNARLISTQFLLQAIDPNEWCLKNDLLGGGLNPQPLSHESSALTTRPLVVFFDVCGFNFLFVFLFHPINKVETK